jgi:hypothetical protein
LTGNVTGTIVGTTGTIATLNSTTSTITNLSATTSTFLGTITGSTNVINIGSGQIYKDGSGNVGIGNTVASTIISAAGGSDGLVVGTGSGTPNLVLYGGTSNYGGLYFADGTTAGDTFRGYVEYNHASNFLRLGTNTNEGMRIDASGNVGIGTASPSGRLHVVAATNTNFYTSSGTTQYQLNSILNGNNANLYYGVEGSSTGRTDVGGTLDNASFFGSRTAHSVQLISNNAARMTIDSSGNVGIGTTSPDAKLAIDASGASTPTAPISCNATSGTGDRYAALFRYSGTLSGSVIVNGASASYNTSSDYRLKTNLEPISNGIERIKQLPVYRFNWKTNESGNKVDGFVAHEVTPIVREAIHGEKDAVDADGNPIYQGIDQSKIVPLLTAALKEAITKIEVLESKVAALEAA